MRRFFFLFSDEDALNRPTSYSGLRNLFADKSSSVGIAPPTLGTEAGPSWRRSPNEEEYIPLTLSSDSESESESSQRYDKRFSFKEQDFISLN